MIQTTTPETVSVITSETANPAPLGLCSLGMTLLPFSLHTAGFFGLNAMVIAMGIFYGGLAQIIAGIIQGRRNNTFGLTAFTSYGFFWLSVAAILILPELGWAKAASNEAMTAFFAVWALFSFLLFIATLRLGVALQFTFALLTLFFILLAFADFTLKSNIRQFAGYTGLICGFASIYTGIADLLNDAYRKIVLRV